MAGQMLIEGWRVGMDAVFKTDATPEAKQLILFSDDITITDATVVGDLTVITTNGGEATALTKATWAAATDADPVVSRYNTTAGVVFTITGNLTVYGWAIQGTTSNALYAAENFGVKTFVNGNTFTCAPIDVKYNIPE